MPAPLLLVDDDLATIAQVKRLLAREGHEVVLATNAADAIIAWGHHLPGLVILSPKVESDRGQVVLDELRTHPDAKLLKVLLLGETIPGFGYPVAPLPLDAETFAQTVHELLGGSPSAAEGWEVREQPRSRGDEATYIGPPPEGTSDQWRATRQATAPAPLFSTPDVGSPAVAEDAERATAEHPAAAATPPEAEPEHPTPIPEPRPSAEHSWFEPEGAPTGEEAPAPEETALPEEAPAPELPPEVEPAPPPAVSPPSADLESALFGDLEAQVQREVEADAIASVDASLAAIPADAELQRLEDDVRAEAARRRKKRQAGTPAVGLPTPDRVLPPSPVVPVDAFTGLDDTDPRGAPVETDPDAASEALSAQLAEASALAKAAASRAEEIAHQAAADAQATAGEAALQAQALEQERAERERLQAELERVAQGEALAREEGGREVERLAAELAEAQGRTAALSEAAAALELELKQTRERAEATAGQVRAEHEAVVAELAALQTRNAELATAADQSGADLTEVMVEAEQAQVEAQSANRRADEAEGNLRKLGSELSASQRIAEEAEGRAQAEATRAAATEASLRQLQSRLEQMVVDVEGAQSTQAKLEEALEDAKASTAEVRARAEQAEATATAAAERARLLEEKAVLPLNVPNRPPLVVARFGSVTLAELARLLGQLVLSRIEVRLELAVPGGRRTIWLQRGAVVAAESNFPTESLLDRARRDGLIDARQANELQLVRGAAPAETVAVLRDRQLVKDAEVVPLVQRFTEQVALDAFSELSSEYRLIEETPGPEVLACTLPRTTLPLVAEALRRALPVDELLQLLGGSEAVVHPLDAGLDLRAVGFSDKERRLLGYCDGEANVEDLALASGLKAEVAYRALMVARLLGAIELKAPAKRPAAPAPEVDAQRLDAKFEQVQDSDYFTMLGLGRAAGSDEVLRAWQRLSEEFDPLKYSGHPDAGLQQRAQVVFSVLEEAARALGDDRRRAEYARHLVD